MSNISYKDVVAVQNWAQDSLGLTQADFALYILARLVSENDITRDMVDSVVNILGNDRLKRAVPSLYRTDSKPAPKSIQVPILESETDLRLLYNALLKIDISGDGDNWIKLSDLKDDPPVPMPDSLVDCGYLYYIPDTWTLDRSDDQGQINLICKLKDGVMSLVCSTSDSWDCMPVMLETDIPTITDNVRYMGKAIDVSGVKCSVDERVEAVRRVKLTKTKAWNRLFS